MRGSLTMLLFAGALAAAPVPAAADAADGYQAAAAEPAHLQEPRQKRRRRAERTRVWVGIGAGMLSGDVEVPCGAAPGGGCSEHGNFISYSANFTVAGPIALRVRAIRANEETDRTPYETAALLGLRLGRSNWYGLLGPGRIRHADDSFQGEAHGLAWEILRAAPSDGAVGFEFALHGNSGSEVDFAGFSLGLRFGSLR